MAPSARAPARGLTPTLDTRREGEPAFLKIDNCATPEQMQQAAGLDWQVERVPLIYAHSDNHRESGHYALIRTSDGQFLDAVKSNRWKPVQNQQAFEFFDRFVRAGEMTMEVAGALSGGRRVFALARLKDGFRPP